MLVSTMVRFNTDLLRVKAGQKVRECLASNRRVWRPKQQHSETIGCVSADASGQHLDESLTVRHQQLTVDDRLRAVLSALASAQRNAAAASNS
jgi:hypothetical protein